MAFPTVVVGLIVFLMLSQQGPFGLLGWLFTPWAIVVAQFIIAFPVIASLTMSAILSINPRDAAAAQEPRGDSAHRPHWLCWERLESRW